MWNDPVSICCNNKVTVLVRVSVQENKWLFLLGGQKSGFNNKVTVLLVAVRQGSTLQAPECCRTILFLHASKDYCTGSPSSVHKENHCDFQHCFAYYELFLDFV